MPSGLEVYSIGIAGWGDATAPGTPYRLRVAHTGDVGGTVIAVPCMGHLKRLSTQIDLHESWIEMGSITVPVTRIDEHAGAIALRRFLFQSNPFPIGHLDDDVARGDTTIEFMGSPEGSAPSVGTVIYIGREAMRVTAVAAGSGARTLTVTRNVFGTQKQEHSAHPLKGDRAVYDVNPIVETREVTLYEYDPASDTETKVWSGILEPPSLDDGLSTLTLKARDSWAAVAGRRLGEGRVEFLGRMGVLYELPRLTPAADDVEWHRVGALPAGNALVLAGESGVAAATFTVVTSPDATDYLQVDHQVVTPLFTDSASWVEWPTDDVELIREVLIADADSDYCMVKDENTDPSDHPLDILLNIWMSTGEAQWSPSVSHTIGANGDYDWLPAHWGLGIPEADIDVAGIIALRDGIFAGLRARNFCLGTEAEPVDAIEVVKRLLKPLFAFPTYTTAGKLSIGVALDPGPGNADATATAGDIISAPGVKAQPWATVKRVRGSKVQVGRRWPTDDFAEVIHGLDNEVVRRNREPYGKTVLEVDAGDYGDPKTGALEPTTRAILRAIDVQRMLVLRSRLPEYELDFRPGFTNLAAGMWVDLTLGVLVGADGDRGTVDGHRCLVLEASRAGDSRVQPVRLMDFWPVTRADTVVLPAWVIGSVAADDEFDIVSNKFTTNDAATWIDGALVNLYDKRGVLRSTDGPTFGSISGTTVTLDAQWQASAVNVTPVAGDVIMPADYDDAIGDWPYGTWIADTSETLGSGNADASRWGL